MPVPRKSKHKKVDENERPSWSLIDAENNRAPCIDRNPKYRHMLLRKLNSVSYINLYACNNIRSVTFIKNFHYFSPLPKDNGGDEENAAFSSDNFQDNGCVNDMSADISSESPLIRSPLSPLENTHFESLAMTETIRRLTEEVSILKKKNTEYEIKCSKQNEEIGKLKNTLMVSMCEMN